MPSISESYCDSAHVEVELERRDHGPLGCAPRSQVELLRARVELDCSCPVPQERANISMSSYLSISITSCVDSDGRKPI